MRLCNESCGQNFIKPCVKYLWIVLGPIMVIGLYSLLILHTYIYFTLIVSPVRMKLGTWPALGWIAIGITLLFNIVFNHILATLIKPNGPRELRQVESLREFYKRRTARKVIKIEDDRFECVSKDVKRLLRYRHKTMADLSFV